ncbi:hypothetical protein ACOMHN_024086 [Nucella lapillus]
MAARPIPVFPSFAPLSSSPPEPPSPTQPSPPSSPPPAPPAPPSPHPDIGFWKERVKDWYPQWNEKPCFVPPVQLNRIYHSTQTVSGEEVAVSELPVSTQNSAAPPTTTTTNSDVRDDQTQCHVLYYLHKLFQDSSSALLVLSQLRYEDYLSEPSFHAAAQTLPRSVDLKKEGKDRGDFDVLIIHRLYGIAQCEIKSVGNLFAVQLLTTDQQDNIVGRRVNRAVTQLQKGKDVLEHLVSDVPHPPRVCSTLMLPHVTRLQLQRVLEEARPDLRQGLCDCLGTAATADPVDLCVTSDMLPPAFRPYDVTDDVIKHLARWWQTLVTSRGVNTAMSEDLYLELFARFAGPSTTVRIAQNSTPRLHASGLRTRGQGVGEVGDRFARVMLTPRQVGVLHSGPPLTFLTGPPGTGKTVGLVLKGLQWLRAGGHVHVCSTWYKSLAASCSIVQQLQRLAGEEGGRRVHLHEFVLSRRGQRSVQRAVETLTAAVARPGPLNVIADEAYYDCDTLFGDFCHLLHQHFGDGSLRLWAASVTLAARPPDLTEVRLTEPLRTPPAVTREVAKCDRLKDGTVYGYTAPLAPLPSDGPQPIFLSHEGEGHSRGKDGPLSCQTCGRRLAQVLGRTERWGRLYAMSRASSQLVCVLWPPADSAAEREGAATQSEGGATQSEGGATQAREEPHKVREEPHKARNARTKQPHKVR